MPLADYERHIRELGFESLGTIKHGYASVFKASKDGSLFTVKFGNGHVIRENEVLDRVGKVDGIVKKVSFHELENDPRLVALVKKYVEGEELSKAERRLVYPDVLATAVNILHEKGVAIVDFWDYNIVLDPLGKPVIIDLGVCVFEDEVSKESFAGSKNYDLSNLKGILRRYK